MSPSRKHKPKDRKDDFATVAKRLECDPDLKAFDKKLGKIAKAKPKAK
jgi:hypothetical protein